MLVRVAQIGWCENGDKCECESETPNATGKPTLASSIYNGYMQGDKALDGIYDPVNVGLGELQSLFHTAQELNPWLIIDLQSPRLVWTVRILNRRGIYIYVSVCKCMYVYVSVCKCT